MRDADRCIGKLCLQVGSHGVDLRYMIVEIEHLSIPGQFPGNDFLHHRAPFLHDICLNGMTVCRRCIELGNGPHADQRHLQSSGNGGGGQ